MPAIRESLVALDTNEYLFALRRDVAYPFCESLVFDYIHALNLYVPAEIQLELRRNLTDYEVRDILEVLRRPQAVVFDYTPADDEAVSRWQARGAKKGDAVISALLERSRVAYFVSENRHFLREISGLPFQVVSSEEAIRLLDSSPGP